MKKEQKSILKMLDFYFDRFTFLNIRDKESVETLVDFSLNFSTEENVEIVKITTTIKSKDGHLVLELVSVGKFEIENKIDEDLKREILTKNTVAIMMPYIRSQISLITTQPGMVPILLPVMNVMGLVDAHFKQEKK